MSVLDDALQLIDDGATLAEWLPMATVHGARALGLAREEVTLAPGLKLGLIGIPLENVGLNRPNPEGAIEWLMRREAGVLGSLKHGMDPLRPRKFFGWPGKF